MFAESMRGIQILGSGGAVPARRLTNAALIAELKLDTTPEWIQSHIGVEARHWVAAGEATSDLALRAARGALQAAGVEPARLGRILLATSSGDWPTPATACAVQAALGAKCPVEDKLAACAGFLYALDHGLRLVATGISPVLVIGADAKSRFLDYGDRLTCSIFGDGAGAVVLGPSEEPNCGFLEVELWADGSRAEDIFVPAGGSRLPASNQTVLARLHGTRIRDGRRAFQEAVELQAGLASTVLERAGLSSADVDWYIPHQANLRIVRAAAERIGVAPERTLCNVANYGNTVAAGIPLALDALLREGRVRAGQLLLMTVVGAGFTGAAVLYRFAGRADG